MIGLYSEQAFFRSTPTLSAELRRRFRITSSNVTAPTRNSFDDLARANFVVVHYFPNLATPRFEPMGGLEDDKALISKISDKKIKA